MLRPSQVCRFTLPYWLALEGVDEELQVCPAFPEDGAGIEGLKAARDRYGKGIRFSMVGEDSPFVKAMSEVGRLFKPLDGVVVDSDAADAKARVNNFLTAGEILGVDLDKGASPAAVAELFPEAVKFFGKDWKTRFRIFCHCQQPLAQRLLASAEDAIVNNIAQNTFAVLRRFMWQASSCADEERTRRGG